MSNLLQLGEVVLHSGLVSDFKIDADALRDDDVACAAALLSRCVEPFGSVEGVPRGGLRLAAAMQPYVTEGPLLIVDDVFTTGDSIVLHRNGRQARGAVIFARKPPPSWIVPLFYLHPLAYR